MNIEAKNITLKDFLCPKEANDKTSEDYLCSEEEKEKSIVFHIPSYQRKYSWGKEQCEALIQDIEDNKDNTYFIGSIIWVEETKDIIDGQQRLTTVFLLLLAIYERLKELQKNTEGDGQNFLDEIKGMVVDRGNNCRIKFSEKETKNNLKNIIDERFFAKNDRTDNENRHHRIYQNYKKFNECLEDKNYAELKEIYEKVTNLTFISVKVQDEQDGYTLFDTMNTRGMPLSAIDIIKNSYMRKGEQNKTKNWEELIGYLGDADTQEQFLRNNYNAFRKEYNNIKHIASDGVKYKFEFGQKANKSNVIAIYNKCINGTEDFIEMTKGHAKSNSYLIGVNTTNNEKLNNIMKNFKYANATSAFMLLLFLLENQGRFEIEDEELLSLFDITLRFFIRRNITNRPSTGKTPQILMDIIDDINQIPETDVDYNKIRKKLLEKFRSETSEDDEIKRILKRDIYKTNRVMARYLLCSLCKPHENKETRRNDLWEKTDKKDSENGKDRYIWTIEHILPEGNKDATNTPKCWMDMIRLEEKYKECSDDEIFGKVREFRHKLGNLTLTGYNSNLGNKSFEEKKERKNDRGEPIGYNNGLSLNDDVYASEKWCISNIENRTEKLIAEIMKNLELPSD